MVAVTLGYLYGDFTAYRIAVQKVHIPGPIKP